MSESMLTWDDDDEKPDAATPAAGASAGALLRQLRESAGVHIDALAGALKVPVAKLQALEDDRHGAFSDAVFMRALASSVCRALRADAAPVLALLPQGTPAQLPPDRSINTSFKDPVRRGGKGGSLEQPRSRLIGIAVVALLVAALVIALLPMGTGGKNDSAVPLAEQARQAATPQGEQEPVDAVGAQHSLAMAQELPAPAASPPAAPAPTEPTRSAATDAAAAQVPVAEGVLVIRANAQTWVQVRNAAGHVLLQKELAAGDSYLAEGSPPWSVVIGRKDAAEVIVRGQPLDMKTIARGNVARFEVK